MNDGQEPQSISINVGYDGLFIAFHYSWYLYLPYVQMFFDNGYDNGYDNRHMFKYDVQIIRYVIFQKYIKQCWLCWPIFIVFSTVFMIFHDI